MLSDTVVTKLTEIMTILEHQFWGSEMVITSFLEMCWHDPTVFLQSV